jgi:hypothetical protein
MAYGREMDRRAREQFSAYYSRDLAQVRAFAERNHIHLLVVNSGDFGADFRKRATFFRPWDELIRRLVRDVASPAELALARVPEEAVLLRDRAMLVVDPRKLPRD